MRMEKVQKTAQNHHYGQILKMENWSAEQISAKNQLYSLENIGESVALQNVVNLC